MGYKHAKVNTDNPVPVGRCGRSGFMVPVTELVKQYEYAGTNLVWKGQWVWNRFLDQPCPQKRTITIVDEPDPTRLE